MQDPAAAATPGTVSLAPDSTLQFGPFPVRTLSVEVEAFRQETGWSALGETAQSSVPQTFPMLWLSAPAIKSLLQVKLEAAGAVAIHESQAFAYEHPLQIDHDYLMQIELDHQLSPARLILRARVVTASGVLALTMETILRLIPASGSPA